MIKRLFSDTILHADEEPPESNILISDSKKERAICPIDRETMNHNADLGVWICQTCGFRITDEERRPKETLTSKGDGKLLLVQPETKKKESDLLEGAQIVETWESRYI